MVFIAAAWAGWTGIGALENSGNQWQYQWDVEGENPYELEYETETDLTP